MNHIKYHQQIGATEACTKIIVESTKVIGQKYINWTSKDCFLFYSCFSSNNLAESAMEVVDDLIGMFRTNTKVLCAYTIDNITNDWPRGSYLVLRIKHMVPGHRPLIDIQYKYNARKVFSFNVTYNSESTQAGIPYLS